MFLQRSVEVFVAQTIGEVRHVRHVRHVGQVGHVGHVGQVRRVGRVRRQCTTRNGWGHGICRPVVCPRGSPRGLAGEPLLGAWNVEQMIGDGFAFDPTGHQRLKLAETVIW